MRGAPERLASWMCRAIVSKALYPMSFEASLEGQPLSAKCSSFIRSFETTGHPVDAASMPANVVFPVPDGPVTTTQTTLGREAFKGEGTRYVKIHRCVDVYSPVHEG